MAQGYELFMEEAPEVAKAWRRHGRAGSLRPSALDHRTPASSRTWPCLRPRAGRAGLGFRAKSARDAGATRDEAAGAVLVGLPAVGMAAGLRVRWPASARARTATPSPAPRPSRRPRDCSGRPCRAARRHAKKRAVRRPQKDAPVAILRRAKAAKRQRRNRTTTERKGSRTCLPSDAISRARRAISTWRRTPCPLTPTRSSSSRATRAVAVRRRSIPPTSRPTPPTRPTTASRAFSRMRPTR